MEKVRRNLGSPNSGVGGLFAPSPVFSPPPRDDLGAPLFSWTLRPRIFATVLHFRVVASDTQGPRFFQVFTEVCKVVKFWGFISNLPSSPQSPSPLRYCLASEGRPPRRSTSTSRTLSLRKLTAAPRSPSRGRTFSSRSCSRASRASITFGPDILIAALVLECFLRLCVGAGSWFRGVTKKREQIICWKYLCFSTYSSPPPPNGYSRSADQLSRRP